MRKLLVACTAALALLGATATTAAAQGWVDVIDSATNQPCPELAEGGCEIVLESENATTGYQNPWYNPGNWDYGIECRSELALRVNQYGDAILMSHSLSRGDDACDYATASAERGYGYMSYHSDGRITLTVGNWFRVSAPPFGYTAGEVTFELERDGSGQWTGASLNRQVVAGGNTGQTFEGDYTAEGPSTLELVGNE